MTKSLIPATTFAVALLLTATACSSSPSSPSPSPAPSTASTSPGQANGFGARYLEAPALLVQCGITRGTIKPPSGQPWLRGDRVTLTGTNKTDFNEWYQSNNGTMIGEKALGDWAEWAANNSKLPEAVCGPSASASKISAELYPGQPNPWSS